MCAGSFQHRPVNSSCVRFCRLESRRTAAEIGINISPAFEPAPPATDVIVYGFVVSSNTPTLGFGEWIDEFRMNDLGKTFKAPPNMAASFARAFTSPSASVTIRVHNFAYSRPLDQLQSGGWGIMDGSRQSQNLCLTLRKCQLPGLQ